MILKMKVYDWINRNEVFLGLLLGTLFIWSLTVLVVLAIFDLVCYVMVILAYIPIFGLFVVTVLRVNRILKEFIHEELGTYKWFSGYFDVGNHWCQVDFRFVDVVDTKLSVEYERMVRGILRVGGCNPRRLFASMVRQFDCPGLGEWFIIITCRPFWDEFKFKFGFVPFMGRMMEVTVAPLCLSMLPRLDVQVFYQSSRV